MTNSEQIPQPQSSKKQNNEWRCECGKLLFKGAFLTGLLEIKCSRCKRMVYLEQFNSYTADNQSFMATLSSEGTVLTASEDIRLSLGYSQEEVVGKNFIDFIDAKFHGAVGFWMEGIENSINIKNPYMSLVLPLIAKDRKEVIFSLLLRPTHLSGKDVYVVIAEAGLSSADSHDKMILSKIAQNSRKQRESWDFIVNSEGLILDSSGKSVLGYEKDELSGKSFLDLLESANQELLNSIKEQEAFVLTLNLKTKTSNFEKFEVCFAPDFLAEPDNPAFIVALRYQEAQQSPNISQTSVA